MPRIFARFSGYFLAMSATIAMPLVQAETIVDTGPATGVGGQSIYHNNGAFQNLATAFTIDQPHVITDIHAWMYLSANQGGPQPVSFLIYRSAGDRPDASGELFAQTAFINSTTPSWQGLSGLNWNLGPANIGLHWNLNNRFPNPFCRRFPSPIRNRNATFIPMAIWRWDISLEPTRAD